MSLTKPRMLGVRLGNIPEQLVSGLVLAICPVLPRNGLKLVTTPVQQLCGWDWAITG
jgi:hypothetical protein